MSLVDETVRRLQHWVVENRKQTGSKLPAEHELAANLQVSRTVVREAVARLKAQGELTSRRGSGVFVAEPRKLGLRLDAVAEVLSGLEIRVALEVEAAGIAARRRRDEQIAPLRAAINAQADAPTREAASQADFAFHRAVALATGNLRFVQLLDQMGVDAIPRAKLRLPEGAEDAGYAARLLDEHRAILDAIIAQDSAYARDAMRLHLSRSIQRYKHAVDTL